MGGHRVAFGVVGVVRARYGTGVRDLPAVTCTRLRCAFGDTVAADGVATIVMIMAGAAFADSV